MAGVSWAPEVGLSSCVRPHPLWSWAGSLRVKASAPSRTPSGPFFRLTPRNPAFVGWGGRNWVRGVLPPPSAAPEQESGVGVVAAPPSLSPWGGAGVPPRLGEDRPAFRPLWGRGCPFFALQGPAQAEREAPGPTVWRMPQTSPFSGGPPFPPPGDASPAAAAPAPSALCGRGGASWGLPSAPGSLGRLWGHGGVSRVTQAPWWSSPRGPPGGGFVGLPPTPHPVPSAAGHTPSTPSPPRCPEPLWSPGGGPVGSGLGPRHPPPASSVARPVASWGHAPLLLGRCQRNVLAVFEKVMVGTWHVIR